MTFVKVRGGSVNANSVVRIQRDSKAGDKAFLKDGTTVEIDAHFFDSIASFVAPQGDWECVIAGAWDDDRLSKIVEPVLAWGFTMDGMLTPITPLYPIGVTDPYALRNAGSDMVYSANDGQQLTVEKWLDIETERARRLENGPIETGRADG